MIKPFDRNMDYGLALAVMVLMAIGVIMIRSTSYGEHIDYPNFWIKQLFWSIVSVFFMFAFAFLPNKFFYTFSYTFYVVGIVMLVLTDLYGSSGGGAERWLKIGSISFQPSEFMKVATILTLARYMSYKRNRPSTYIKCLIPFFIAALPAVLILKQPDLGTSLVFFAIILPMVYWAGLDTLRLFFLVAPMVSAILCAPFIPISWVVWVVFMFFIIGVLYFTRYHFIGMGIVLFTNILAGVSTSVIFSHLKPYQQKRITAVLNPEADALGAGWQIINSKIAIGSGGLLGKGIGKGRYTELGFLPRSHNDFIFSVIGEEMGFVGSFFVLAVIFYIVTKGIMIAYELKDSFMSLAAIGISTVFAFHMFVNVGMVIGIMPVTGLPLPFLSYGGSSCVSNAIMIGLLMNFKLNRHKY
ncbi:rod shape-determining protein RodA [Candidatus Latescibacterota bacterium]